MLPDGLSDVPLVSALLQLSAAAVTGGSQQHNQLSVWIDPGQIFEVCRFLKQDHRFERLSSVTAVDRYPVDPRFEVVYHLHSISGNQRVRLKSSVGEAESIDSVYPVWHAADWYEREIFDLFGINFRNHPDLKRILMPHDWEGHPLRKDYPVHGHRYSYQNE